MTRRVFLTLIIRMTYIWLTHEVKVNSEVAFKSLYLNDFTTYLENSHKVVDGQKKFKYDFRNTLKPSWAYMLAQMLSINDL